MKKLIMFCALALSGALSGQNKIDFEEYDLKNGLHVILHEDHSTPIVAVTMMYRVGSKNEEKKSNRICSFF